MVTSFTDYLRTFGGFRLDSFLTYAVQAFFDNGGRRLYISRVAGAGVKASASATTAAIKLSALTEGKWGDKITVAITNSSDGNTANNFALVVSYDGLPVETFDTLTFQGSATLDATTPPPLNTPAPPSTAAPNTWPSRPTSPRGQPTPEAPPRSRPRRRRQRRRGRLHGAPRRAGDGQHGDRHRPARPRQDHRRQHHRHPGPG